MSDTRFIMLGIVLVFTGFLILGILGKPYFEFTIQANNFGDCIDYTQTGTLSRNCDVVMQDKLVFFAAVIGLIGFGIVLLVKGYRGTWDQDVKSDETVGPKKD